RAGVVAEIADRGGDPARVSGEGLGGGVEGGGAAVVDLAEVLDDLPDIGPVREGGGRPDGPSLKMTPGWSAIRKPSSMSCCARAEVLEPARDCVRRRSRAGRPS